MRPYLCHIENVVLVASCFFFRHHLDVESPTREVLLLDSIPKIFSCRIRVFFANLCCLLSRKVFDTLVCLEVVLDVEPLALGVDPDEGVRGVAIHVSVAVRGASI